MTVMPAPSETEPASRAETAPRGGLFALWSVPLLLLLYVLSTGPVLKFCGGPTPTFMVVYSPLVWLSEHCRPVNNVLDWYCDKLWHV